MITRKMQDSFSNFFLYVHRNFPALQGAVALALGKIHAERK